MRWIILAFFLPYLSIAQNIDSVVVKQLDDIVVTATRSGQSAYKTPSLIYIIGQPEIKNTQVRSTPEIFQNSSGIFVQKTTHGGGSPFVRGLAGNQILLLVDGIRLNNSTFRYGPNQYLNTIDVFTISRAEVLLGGGSVQYGSDALSGTIQLFTTDPTFDTSLNIDVIGRLMSGGMEQSGRVQLGYGTKQAAFQGGYTRRRFGDVLGGKNTGFQRPSGYEEDDFDIKTKFKIKDNLLLTLAHQSVSQQNVSVYYRYQLDNFKLNQFDPQKRNLTYLKLTKQNKSKIFNNQTITLSRQHTKEGRQSLKVGSTTMRNETDKVQTLGVCLENNSVFLNKSIQISSGIETYYDKIESERFDENTTTKERKYSRGLYPNNANSLNYAAYSILTAEFKKWNISGGLRYNGFVINVPDETIGTTRLSPKALVYHLGLSYQLVPNLLAFTHLSTGFRSPNIDDLGTLGVVDFRYEIPTNNLKPEYATTYEVGLKTRYKYFQVETAYYKTTLRDIIARVLVPNQQINGINVYKKENTELSYLHGFDIKLSTSVLNHLKLSGNLSYCFGQNQTKDEPMRRIPPLNGRFGANYDFKNWWIRPEYWFAKAQDRLAQGDKDDNRIAKGGTPAWEVFNVYLGYSYKKMSLAVSAQNLFDEDYRTHGSGINGYGRSYGLTFEIRN